LRGLAFGACRSRRSGCLAGALAHGLMSPRTAVLGANYGADVKSKLLKSEPLLGSDYFNNSLIVLDP